MLYYRTQNLKKDGRAIDYPFFGYRIKHQIIDYIQDYKDAYPTKKRNSETKFNYSALVARSRIPPPFHFGG
ncbi:MAG TPA: hypothetical protein DCX01_00600 [Bacteroidetes bacterium]|nr:hypothetical protein [Bacteroidota bacterium]